MKGCIQTQASVRGEGRFSCLCGQIRISPLGCGSAVQAHVRGLPRAGSFFGLRILAGDCTYPLPPLMACGGEALMSVYSDRFSPEDTLGGQVVITTDPCLPACKPIACGCISPCVRPLCPKPDPRPLFGAPPRPLPGGSIFC